MAVPPGRSSKERRLARNVQSEAQVIDDGDITTGRAQAPQAAQAGWNVAPSRQTPACSASGSLADATDKELKIVDDQDEEEAADEEEEDKDEEDCQSERSVASESQRAHSTAAMQDVVTAVEAANVKTDEPRTTSKTHHVNVARLSQVSEEEERLTGYLIEAHALELEPQNWRLSTTRVQWKAA